MDLYTVILEGEYVDFSTKRLQGNQKDVNIKWFDNIIFKSCFLLYRLQFIVV